MTKILVVSHEASLTGAPRVALDILRAAEGRVDERVALVRWPGPLVKEFADVADRVRLEPARRLRVGLRRFRRTRPAAVRVEESAAHLVLRAEKPDLVYLNSLFSACYARPALARGCRVVLHSHETGDLASNPLGRYDLGNLYGKMRLVACSGAAASRLQELTGMDRIDVIRSVVDISRVQRLALEPHATPAAGPVVLACGTADERKGADLWLEVAKLADGRPGSASPTFVWVGNDVDGRYQRLGAQAGLGTRVLFTGPTPNPYPMMASADVVTVPSRQDPSPLVVFEAMALGKPVVAFAVGGIPEQIGDAGILVPPSDVRAMADAVVGLLNDQDARDRLGRAGQERVRQMFGIEGFQEQVRSLLAEELRGGPHRRHESGGR